MTKTTYSTRYSDLEIQRNDFLQAYPADRLKTFAAEQLIRFLGLGGTMMQTLASYPAGPDRNSLLNLIGRPLIESYFWMEYIFDGPDRISWEVRYDEFLVSFKQEYAKLYNEPQLPYKSTLDTSDPEWARPVGVIG
jgi:hypothetical protein